MRPVYRGRQTMYYKNKLKKYLLENVNPKDNSKKKVIKKAFEIAYETNKNIYTKYSSNEPFIAHIVDAAIIVSNEMGMGTTTVIATLLRYVVQRVGNYNIENIKKLFGESVSSIILGVEELTKLRGELIEKLNEENKSNNKISKDLRIFIIKIAYNLLNLRRTKDLNDEIVLKNCIDNIYFYSNIANFFGFWDIKNEIEDLSFKIIDTESYENIKELSRINDNDLINRQIDFQNKIKVIINIDTNYYFETIRNSLYNTWLKTNRNNCEYKNIYNLFLTRIIIDTTFEIVKYREYAYKIYAQITKKYPSINFIKHDFIIYPKKNGFRALIFNIMYEDGNWIQIQIMSKEDSISSKKSNINIIGKLQKHIIENTSSNNNILQILHNEINTKSIFVYTRNGSVVELPKGATVIDLAYAINSDIGNNCIGAKINKNQTVKPPNYKLQTMQMFEIITNINSFPKKEWLNFVVTDNAKNNIKKFLSSNIKTPITNKVTFSENPYVIDDNTFFIIAECCKPIIGNECIAHYTYKNDILVHKENCPNIQLIKANETKNTTKVIWNTSKAPSINIDILVKGTDRNGIVIDITDVLTNALNINIKKIFIENKKNFFTGCITLNVNSTELFDNIAEKLKEIKNISKVEIVNKNNK